jgi:hypothetical protein
MTFMFLEFSFLAIRGGMDRKFEKIRRSTNRGRGEDLGAVEPANLAKEWLGPRGRKAENLLHESEAALRTNDI